MNELRDVLQEIQSRQGMTIDDLVDEADRLLPVVADRQTRYKVTDRPDVRTIRYYVTRGLLPRASGYEGGRARYGGAHLMRLLLIKKLQAEHHTLTRISSTLEGADDRSVLRLLLGEDSDPSPTSEGGVEGIALLPEPGEAPPRGSMGAPVRGPLAGRTVWRVEFPGGASLDVPPETVASPAAREALARALEAAAATLRSEQKDKQESEQEDKQESEQEIESKNQGETP